MLRTAFRRKVNDGPSAKGGPSPWLLIAVMATLIGIIGHFARPAAKNRVMTGVEAAVKNTPAPAIVSRHENSRPAISEDAQAARLVGLVHDFNHETNPNQREDLLAVWVAEIKTDEISGCLNFLKSASPPDLALDLSRRLLRRWTDVSPEKASAWLAALQPDRQLALLDDVAIPWANSDPTNAMKWAESFPDDAARRQALAAVAGEAIRSQPLLALEIAVELPAGPQQVDLVRRGAMQWTSEDAGSAVAWIKQIPADDLRNQAMSGAAIVWSASEPVAAANLALEELPPGRLLDDTVISIVERWAQQQPEAATGWADQFAAGPLRNAALENIRAQIQRKKEEETSPSAGTRRM
jgi:hypothetical protein